MRLLSEPDTAAPVECPYLPDRSFVQNYFFAAELDSHEFGVLLNAGWRRFGNYFFRPSCPGCSLCIPLRIDARNLSPSASQRRVIRRGEAIIMDTVRPAATDEAWQVYKRHSAGQFGRDVNRADFETTFFHPAVPAIQTEYRLDGRLIALGFLDIADEGMSSVYFAFDPGWAEYSTGILSVFRESELVRAGGGRWYYLGYWVPGCASMDYKARYLPHQLYDWELKEWVIPEEHPFISENTEVSHRGHTNPAARRPASD
jgi:arginine-tRNA-protein transferase